MKDNLIDYLIENSDKQKSRWIDLMRYNIGIHIYGYGDQFKNSKINSFFFNTFRDYIEFLAIKIHFVKNQKKDKKILSSAYSEWNNNLELEGYSVFNPVWNLRRNFKIETSLKLYLLTKKIKNSFHVKDFNYLISDEFILLLEKFKNLFKQNCIKNNYRGLIVPQDVGFFEKLAIEVFKELNLPTIFWAHGGMPSRYDKVFGNRTDFSVQWGDKQINAFVEKNYDKSKFRVSGHPYYIKKPKNLRFGLERILVLTKSLTRMSPENKIKLEDRGNAIMYLLSIQRILEKIGINRVFLRPHPSENYNWYKKFIDNTFYDEDKDDFSNSLNKSTLVIGPVSTSLIDAIQHSVNYIVYEPLIKNTNIYGKLPTPPLDGKDSKIPIANSEKDLEKILIKRKKIDLDVYDEFLKTPYDLSFLKKII